NIYFGFQALTPNRLNLRNGIARMDPSGNGTWIAVSTAASDSNVTHVPYNCAPALSNDEARVYVGLRRNDGSGYLGSLSSTTLQPQARVALHDPRTGNNASLSDSGTSSPTVGPDGDVYYGVLESPGGSHHSRGWLLHFSGALSQTRTPGSFG